MPRIRTIKPEFWTDSKLARGLTRDQRLLYIGLWNQADDKGRFRASARMLLGVIFPFDEDLDTAFIEGALERMHELERVVLYEADGERFGQIVRFREHQVINKPSHSSIPAPDNDLDLIPVVVPEGDSRATMQEREREREREKEYVDSLWGVFLEELGGNKPHPKLTKDRRKKLTALYREQLSSEDDPLDLFRMIMRAVKDSQFHMSNRAYQMPESLFVNANRRDRWVMDARQATPAGSWAAEEAARLRGGAS